MDGSRWSHLDANTSLNGYASTAAMSTREPLSSGPPHPLLESFNSLLSSLLIPISLPSLSLATPTLLLTVLEALLETRLIDVPEDYRGSWERNKRTRVAEVLVEAIGEVLDGLARAKGNDIDQRWRAESVDVRAVVRGAEGELAKLVNGLLRIAEGLGVNTVQTETDLRRRQKTDDSPQTTPKARPSTQIHRPLPILPSKLPSESPLPASSLRPPALFATRALHPTPTIPPLKPNVRSNSSRSSSSHSSQSTSLTVPSHRPSLAKELERSGTLSPPPRMPGSPRKNGRFSIIAPASEERRARSTLQLMRERREEVTNVGESKEEENEDEDVFLTPRNGAMENGKERQRKTKDTKSSDAAIPRGDAKEQFKSKTNDTEARSPTGNERGGRSRREKENSKGKGKEREKRGEGSRRRSKEAQSSEGCCEGCGSTLLSEGFASTTSTSTSPLESVKPPVQPRNRKALPTSHGSRKPSRKRKGGRKSKEREQDWCECHSGEGEEAETSEEEEDSSSSSTLGKTKNVPTRYRYTTRPRDPGKPHRSGKSTQLAKPSSIPSPSARRIRIERRSAIELAEEAALLSVHGESEIERFENSDRNSHSVLISDPPIPSSTPSTPQTQQIETVPAALPSPYTMLLLAQRAELAEKLRALERRERDRVAAREARGMEPVDRAYSNGSVLEV